MCQLNQYCGLIAGTGDTDYIEVGGMDLFFKHQLCPERGIQVPLDCWTRHKFEEMNHFFVEDMLLQPLNLFHAIGLLKQA